MVRRGRKRYRTQAQRDHRNRRRGGNTREETRARRIREDRRALRDAGKCRIEVSAKPVRLAPSHLDSDAPVFGIYRDDSEGRWVLTALSFSRYRLSTPDGAVEYQGHYLGTPAGTEETLWPDYGVRLSETKSGTYPTKKAALAETGADTSDRLKPGHYLIRPSHDPNRLRTTAEKDAVKGYITRFARRVYE
jgi:hypothetical protein